MHNLRDATVVIVGASSGIGLATARAFARRGCRLFLAARRRAALEEVARQCRALGAPMAQAIPADATDAAQMRALARRAAIGGGIDVWVNVAGVAAFGPYERIPLDLQQRVIAVNLTGTMNGAHAALPWMLARDRGVIVNMSSLAARIPHSFATAYSASKFGVAGFTEALRQEVLARSRVQVCAVYPAFVDTPIPRHAANYTGRALRPLPPVLDPAEVAEAIVDLARAPRRAVHLGLLHAGVPLYALLPELFGRVMGALAERLLMHTGPRHRFSRGTVLAPRPDRPQARIGWGPSLSPAWTALGIAGLLAAVIVLPRRRA